jgi:hypothetical protein
VGCKLDRVDWLRETSAGKPIGIKLAAGDIEADLGFAVYAGPDFITIDGRAGATGSAPKFVKARTSDFSISVIDTSCIREALHYYPDPLFSIAIQIVS